MVDSFDVFSVDVVFFVVLEVLAVAIVSGAGLCVCVLISSLHETKEEQIISTIKILKDFFMKFLKPIILIPPEI